MFKAIKNKKIFNLSPTQIIVLGFALVIIIGGTILSLPISWQEGKYVSPLNAYFTSTSAVCVTGLATVDTGSTYSAFGKTVIIILIQIGGLGFMTVATAFFMAFKRKITMRERLVLQESLNEDSSQGMVKLVKKVLLMTFIFEAVGALLLMTQFVPEYGLGKGIAFGFFHSISAFCNAGFDILGTDNSKFISLINYIDNPVVTLTIGGLIVFGGLGFSVIKEIVEKRRFSRLSLHTKAVLIVTTLLLIAGFVFFIIIEWDNKKTIGNESVPVKVLASMFQSIVPRTAGFSTIDQSQMHFSSKVFTTLLMFIGASPASTGGGIKTTTLFLMAIMVSSIIKGKEDFEVFKKRISYSTIYRAVAIIALSIILVMFVATILYGLEYDNPATDSSFENILFETVSAFGTVGLSCNLTPYLTGLSKTMLILTMFAGRVGVLTLTFSLIRRQSRPKAAIRYPEDKMMVG